MKMMNIKSLLLAGIVLATVTSCINSDEYDAPDLSGYCTTLSVTKQVTDITSAATASYVRYEDADVIEAYVTSSDEGGNFFKSISLVSTDGLTGFSVPVDAYNLYTKFEPGRKVYLNLKATYFVKENGSTVIGGLYDNNTPNDPLDDEVGRLSGIEYGSFLKRGCDNVDEETLVNHLTIAQAKNDANLNKLIEFNNVQFKAESFGKKYYDASLNDLGGATNHLITDEFGNTIIVRISSYSTFASRPVPQKNGKIRGVLTKFGSDYQFMVRTENDIMLTNDLLTIDFSPPVGGTAISYLGAFTEPFTPYAANLSVFPAYVNDPVVGTRYWQVKTFSGNKYMQMSSFGGTAEVNRTLFIVPVDMTAASNFSFKTLSGFDNGSPLKIYYSMDYIPGTNTSSATFVDITSSFNIPHGPTTGYAATFTNSGVYAIPASLTGNGYFIFEYNGSGLGGVTTTMEVDDITVN